MDKRPFQKSVRFVNTKVLGAEFNTPLPEHTFQMWADPSNRVWLAIHRATTMEEEELEKIRKDRPEEYEEIEAEYRWAISELVIDTDIQGLSFATPEDVRAAFNNPDVDNHFLTFVITYYMLHLFAVRKNRKSVV